MQLSHWDQQTLANVSLYTHESPSPIDDDESHHSHDHYNTNKWALNGSLSLSQESMSREGSKCQTSPTSIGISCRKADVPANSHLSFYYQQQQQQSQLTMNSPNNQTNSTSFNSPQYNQHFKKYLQEKLNQYTTAGRAGDGVLPNDSVTVPRQQQQPKSPQQQQPKSPQQQQQPKSPQQQPKQPPPQPPQQPKSPQQSKSHLPPAAYPKSTTNRKAVSALPNINTLPSTSEVRPPLSPIVHSSFDLLWDSRYLTRTNINDLIEENKGLRAKLWNYEKEIRKMGKQLEVWGLEGEVQNEAKPFVDSTTLQKVFKDTQYQSVSKKQEMYQLQSELEAKEEEIKRLNGVIQLQKNEGNLMQEFEKDQIQQFYVLFKQAKLDVQEGQLEQFEERKRLLKQDQIHIQEVNQVIQFEIEVQQNMCLKLCRETEQFKKKIQQAELWTEKMEKKLKDKSPHTYNQETQQLRVTKLEKTPEEILQNRINQIEEYDKKIKQLNFQIQEMVRTCIMEKQDLLKEIKEIKDETKQTAEKILLINLSMHKFDQFDAAVSSDKSNCHDSILTQKSQREI